MFKQFSRMKAQEEVAEGTGLGLYFAKYLSIYNCSFI